MLFAKRPTSMALGLCLAGATFSGGALADGFTGKTSSVCAAVSVVACTDDFACLQGNAHTFGLPPFLFIDVKKNIVRGVEVNAEETSSPILTKEITESSVILQGHENHRGWTIAIDRTDGRLDLSSTGPEVNFMITGNCVEL